MNKEQFFYWIKGFSDLHGKPPTEQEWQVIKDHINLVEKPPIYLGNGMMISC